MKHETLLVVGLSDCCTAGFDLESDFAVVWKAGFDCPSLCSCEVGFELLLLLLLLELLQAR